MSDESMELFLLKPRGDDRWAAASRAAMRTFARIIEPVNPTFAKDMRELADKEWTDAMARGAFDEKSSEQDTK